MSGTSFLYHIITRQVGLTGFPLGTHTNLSLTDSGTEKEACGEVPLQSNGWHPRVAPAAEGVM